jgi:large subunit ribosomal protein L31e
MAEENKNIVLERQYTVPLRRKWKNTPKYRRVPRAIKALKQFLAKHMKVEERNTNKILIDKLLNEEIWFRGINKPPIRIKVKAKKYADGIVRVELAELPQALKWKAERAKRKEKQAEEVKKAAGAAAKPQEKPKEQKPEEKAEEKEKERSVVEQETKEAKKKAKQHKHAVTEKKGIKKPLARKALKK